MKKMHLLRCLLSTVSTHAVNDPEHTKLAIWVGGNHSNARSKPSFQKLVASGIPNNPPRWPEATAIVKRILNTYKDDARDWERINDWIDRIGWPRFFELTGLPFTKYHIDHWRGSRQSLNASTHIRFLGRSDEILCHGQ